MTAAEWRAGRLRQALAEVADLAKGEARTRALAALAADRVAFPAGEGSGE